MSQIDPASVPPPAPVPVQALPYSLPVRARPGIITAIGVMSIVVAGLSGLFSFGSGIEAAAFYMMTRVASALSTATATSPSATTQSAPVNTPSLQAGDAEVAVNQLKTILSLDPAHVRELDRLLRSHGRQIFGGDDDAPVTSAFVRSALIAKVPQPAGGNLPAHFTTNQGNVDVYSDRAVFTSADGSLNVQTSAKRQNDQITQSLSPKMTVVNVNANNASSPGTMLTAAEVSRVMAAVRQVSPTPLNAAQLKAVRTAVSAPDQELVTPGISSPVAMTSVQPNGNAVVTFSSGGMLVLGPQGQVISSGPPPMPVLKVSTPAVLLVIGESLASIALAIYLLVVGIMVLRGSAKAVRRLRIYAWLKIPLALIAGAGISWMGMSFFMSVSSASVGPSTFSFVFGGVVLAMLGLAFPIALLIAFRTRTVKDYYNTVAAE